MDAFVVIALIAVALLLAELLLPTGGLLALLGAAGLVAAGIVALERRRRGAPTTSAPALITARRPLGRHLLLRHAARSSRPTATSRCAPAGRS